MGTPVLCRPLQAPTLALQGSCSLSQTQEVSIPPPAWANRPASLLSDGLNPTFLNDVGTHSKFVLPLYPPSALGCHVGLILSHSCYFIS